LTWPTAETNQLYTSAINATLQALSTFVSGRDGIYQPDRNNFGPSFGFAWDPLAGKSNQAGKTVLRGGFGLYYDVALGSVVSQSRNVFPTFIPYNVDVNTFNLAGAIHRFAQTQRFHCQRDAGQGQNR